MQPIGPFHLLIFAAVASMLIILPVWRFAPRLGLVDMPDPRKVHKAPVPRVGGWGITLGTLLPLLLWRHADVTLQSYVLGSLILFAFGVWDDAREIGHWPKFAGQVIAALIVVYYGDLYITYVPFVGDGGLSPAVGKPFTVFAIVGAINAINHSDGLDGLAAGECLLSLIALASLGYLAGNAVVVGVALAMVGGIFGFLRYNSHPARVFMGDAGSQVLGFTVAFLTIYLTQVADTALSPALALAVIGVPLTDILAVLFQRIRGGMNWFKATRNHVHHRLLDLGFRHYETVVIIYSIQALLVVSAVLMRYSSDTALASTYVLILAVLFGSLTLAERTGWRRGARSGSRLLRWSLVIAGWERRRWVRDFPRMLITFAVPAFMLLGALWVHRVPRDVAWVCAVLAAVVATEIGRARATGSTLVRFAVYVAAIASVFLIVDHPGPSQGLLQLAALSLVVTLAVAIGGYVKFATDRPFGTTPTDYLILFVTVALLIFANIDIGARALVELIVCAIVLLYSCEVLIGVTSRRWNALHLSTLATLTILAARGVLSP